MRLLSIHASINRFEFSFKKKKKAKYDIVVLVFFFHISVGFFIFLVTKKKNTLAMPHSMWDLCCPTRNRTHTPGTES